MQRYWDSVRNLFGPEKIEEYLSAYDRTHPSCDSLDVRENKYEVITEMVLSLFDSAERLGHLRFLPIEHSEGVWSFSLGKYEYLTDLYKRCCAGPVRSSRHNIVSSKIKEIPENELFGLFAVSILNILQIRST